MTIDIQEASRIYQAGIEVGRSMAKRETEEFAKLVTATAQHVAPAAKAAMPSKAIVTGRGLPVGTKIVTKPPAARTKGVKEAIVKLINESAVGMTTGDIIAKTGHKKTSIRATLMSMKNAGQAFQEGANWFMTRPVDRSGNSETVVRSEY